MPWHIETDHPECSGYGVVKDGTRELEGCHRTRAQAEAQMAALYASEPEARSPFTPTGAMRDEARRGLAWREEFGRGGTAVGVARARDISNGRELPLETVARMVSYFARHEIDKEGQGFYEGDDGYPSAGRIAWALWGGDPGKEWAEDILDSEENDGEDDLEDRAIGEQRIVTDIDGTIVLDGTRPVRRIIDEINAAGITVYVLTGRPENRRTETEQLLADIGLVYDELYMVGSQQAKRAKIADLASEYDIVRAYENDATARAYYETFGVPLASLRSRSAYVEEMLAELRSARYSSQ